MSKKTYHGRVISERMNKTVVVAIERRYTHSRYGKVLRRMTALKAHDEENRCQRGDEVKIVETRPLSKEKRWKVIEVLTRRQADDSATHNA